MNNNLVKTIIVDAFEDSLEFVTDEGWEMIKSIPKELAPFYDMMSGSFQMNEKTYMENKKSIADFLRVHPDYRMVKYVDDDEDVTTALEDSYILYDSTVF